MSYLLQENTKFALEKIGDAEKLENLIVCCEWWYLVGRISSSTTCTFKFSNRIAEFQMYYYITLVQIKNSPYEFEWRYFHFLLNFDLIFATGNAIKNEKKNVKREKYNKQPLQCREAISVSCMSGKPTVELLNNNCSHCHY